MIIVAAGSGRRMKSKTKKQYLCLDGIPVLARTLMAVDACAVVNEVVLVISGEDRAYCEEQIVAPYGFRKTIHLVDGGCERQDSVFKGLEKVAALSDAPDQTLVLIHDGVRPFVDASLINACITAAAADGACVPALAVTDTLKQVDVSLRVEKTIPRQRLYSVQTPQVFAFDLIWKAFAHAWKTSFYGTDDASLVEHYGQAVTVVHGSKYNIKLTTPEDLELGQWLIHRNARQTGW